MTNQENITTREYIINTANRLFLEKGYNNTTLTHICEACGISRTTFYYHLKSKEDIILHFYDTVAANISKNLIIILAKDNPWEQLLTFFELIVTESKKYGHDFIGQILIANIQEDRGSYDLQDELTEIALMIVQKGQEQGLIRNKSNPEALYVASAYAFLGLETTWCIKNGTFEWSDELTNALEAIYDIEPEFRKR